MIHGSRLHVVALALALPLVAQAQAYPPVPPAPPSGTADQLYQLYYPRSHGAKSATPSDIVMQQGFADTVVFKILNLSPYWMKLSDASRALLTEQRSRIRWQSNQFMFAPVGLPHYIQPGSNLDPDGGYRGITSAHPRSFVLSWNPWGFVPQTHLNWVVQGVDYVWCANDADASTCGSYKNDQYLGLWVSYESPPDELESGSFELMMSIVEETIGWLGIMLDPLNPVAWIAFGFTTKGLVDEGIDFAAEQKKPDYGEKFYVSAYTIPDWNRECFTLNNQDTWLQTGHTGEPVQYKDCSPTTVTPIDADSDGYDAQWGDYVSGKGPAALVVLTMGLRGKKATFTDQGGPSTLGSLPMVSVVVMTGKQYEASHASALFNRDVPPVATPQPGPVDLDKEKVVREARKIRDRYGVDLARRALVETVLALDGEEQQALHDAVYRLLARNPITHQQEKFLMNLLRDVERLLRGETGKER